MTNAQQYIAQLTTKLDITEGVAREMTAQRAEAARKSAQPVERAHDCDSDHIRYVTQHDHGAWFILDSLGLRADSHGYSDLDDALNHVAYGGEAYKAVTGREPSSVHPHSSMWT